MENQLNRGSMGLALPIALSTATGWAQSSGSAVTYNQRTIAR
ncbi:MAG TPA: hypothetical protein VNO24_12975 [Blastocatellia bacterium]|nr:hypothetical protein [Blastocatellia bacterium]